MTDTLTPEEARAEAKLCDPRGCRQDKRVAATLRAYADQAERLSAYEGAVREAGAYLAKARLMRTGMLKYVIPYVRTHGDYSFADELKAQVDAVSEAQGPLQARLRALQEK
jgi:hypothetical protein